MNQSVKPIITATITRLTPVGSWCQCHVAEDFSGEMVAPWDSHAKRWCLVGAIAKEVAERNPKLMAGLQFATKNNPDAAFAPGLWMIGMTNSFRDTINFLDKRLHSLYRTLQASTPENRLWDFNDESSQYTVLNFLTKAVAEL